MIAVGRPRFRRARTFPFSENRNSQYGREFRPVFLVIPFAEAPDVRRGAVGKNDFRRFEEPGVGRPAVFNEIRSIPRSEPSRFVRKIGVRFEEPGHFRKEGERFDRQDRNGSVAEDSFDRSGIPGDRLSGARARIPLAYPVSFPFARVVNGTFVPGAGRIHPEMFAHPVYRFQSYPLRGMDGGDHATKPRAFFAVGEEVLRILPSFAMVRHIVFNKGLFAFVKYDWRMKNPVGWAGFSFKINF